VFTVIHDLLDVAVQAQSEGDTVRFAVYEPPPTGTFCDAGVKAVMVQTAPFWVMENVWVAMVTLPVRSEEDVLALTVTLDEPAFLFQTGGTAVIHEGSLGVTLGTGHAVPFAAFAVMLTFWTPAAALKILDPGFMV
jgi:hypothetical protein